jgi:hypothetical protein
VDHLGRVRFAEIGNARQACSAGSARGTNSPRAGTRGVRKLSRRLGIIGDEAYGQRVEAEQHPDISGRRPGERPLSVLTAHPDGRLPRSRRRRHSPSRSQDKLEGPKRHRRARPGSQSVSAASSFAAYPDCGGIEIRWRSQQIYKHVQLLRVARAAAGLRSSARPPMATQSPRGSLHRHC